MDHLEIKLPPAVDEQHFKKWLFPKPRLVNRFLSPFNRLLINRKALP